MLATAGVDDLARDDLEMALFLPMTAANVAAIKPNHHRTSRWRHNRFRRLGGVLAYHLLAHPPRSVSDRACVLRPAHRQQFRQQGCHFAERCQRRIPGRDVGQLRGNRIIAEIQHGKALRCTLPLTATGKQPSNPHRHIAKQGAERNRVAALARQAAPARRAAATEFTDHIHLRRHDLGLKCGGYLLHLSQPESEIS
jgi:hypothetical protein